jgi:predicted metalloprotease with PDZ domain
MSRTLASKSAQNIQVAIRRALEGTPKIELTAVFPCEGPFEVQLPVWRPGRYEKGNFGRYVYSMRGKQADGTWVDLKKSTLHKWQVPEGIHTISWTFFADLFNAGSTGVAEDILYINPINCFLYRPDHQDWGYSIELIDVPDNWSVATGLKHSNGQWHARDVQHVMDSPILASEALTHLSYESQGIPFHIWIYGKDQPNPDSFLKDHIAFTESQIAHFGSFPAEHYHFMYVLPERDVRHGVEHEDTTVIAIGPSAKSQTKAGYNELIGIASHELYHAWNVKRIRPVEWTPYDFSQECPSRLGYVAEGVTTYMGDLFLFESGVIDLQGWSLLTERLLDRHVNNPGRLNCSVAESSYDTWLDGYESGVPGRKGSIYVEGAVLALLCDVRIMQLTGGEASLQTAMRMLWEQFGADRIGLTESDYWSVLNEVAGATDALEDLRLNYAEGVEDSWDDIAAAMEWQGLEVTKTKKDGRWHVSITNALG